MRTMLLALLCLAGLFAACADRTKSSHGAFTEVERLEFEPVMYDDIASEDRTVSYLDEDHFVGVSFGGAGKFFSLYDNRMKRLNQFGDGPVAEELDPLKARESLSGFLATHNGALVHAAEFIPKIQFYQMDGSVPRKMWEDTFYDSYYRVENRQVRFDPEKTVGVIRGLELGEKYVYILFLDMSMREFYEGATSSGKIVLVYDHAGRRLARLNLDLPIQDLTVSPDETTLYGIAETPEYRIASFALPRLGK